MHPSYLYHVGTFQYSFYEAIGMWQSKWEPTLIRDTGGFKIMQCYNFPLYRQCTLSYQHKLYIKYGVWTS